MEIIEMMKTADELCERGKYEQALPLRQEILAACKEKYGNGTLLTLVAINNLGYCRMMISRMRREKDGQNRGGSEELPRRTTPENAAGQ